VRNRSKPVDDPVRDTEAWFLKNGLPYFVPAERAQVRHGLALRRTLPLLGVSVLVALGVALLLSWATSDFELDPGRLLSFGPASLLTIAGLTLAIYGVTALRARPILTYALRHSGASLRTFATLATRALPLLMVFMTFLFINAEVWHMSASLDGAALWIVVLLFVVLGIVFFLVRLPEEIDRADDELDDARVVEVVRATPMGPEAERLSRHEGLLSSESRVAGYERANLTLVLLITQTVQALLLSVTVFVFFMLFGMITMKQEMADVWIDEAGPVRNLDALPNLSVELLQVSTFLAAFSGLYFIVYALTDEVYRQQFFSKVQRDLERAIAVRGAYVAWHRVNGREGDLDEARLLEVLEAESQARQTDRETGGTPATTQMPVVPPPDDQPTVRLRAPRD
jgi:hypothetical protein